VSVYCRVCDLAFCPRHVDDHTDGCRGEPIADERATFCSVCAGIYRPTPKENQ